MSWTTNQYVTVAAIVVLVASLPLVWQLAEVREAQAVDHQELTQTPQAVSTPAASVVDRDGDGLNASVDRCPTRAETRNGYQDGDGCPDVVATTGAS